MTILPNAVHAGQKNIGKKYRKNIAENIATIPKVAIDHQPELAAAITNA
jgi:hypothetical protein